LLRLEASRARVFQFYLKTSGGAMVGGAVEVGPNYPSLDVIFLLTHRGILVFCFYYK
jgi:hypothetical protein